MSATFGDYPPSFSANSGNSAPHYRIRHDCFAGRGDVPGYDSLPVLQCLPGDGLNVFAGPLPDFRTIAGLDPRPVYSQAKDDPPAIPTGLVFVQGRSIESLQAAVEPLGYVLQSVPPYAPCSAWLANRDQSIATALARLAALYRLTAIISAEPQMLRPAARR